MLKRNVLFTSVTRRLKLSRRLRRLLVSGSLLLVVATFASYGFNTYQSRVAAADGVVAGASAKLHLESCQPAPETAPAPLPLQQANNGLTSVVDAPTPYIIHGSSAREIRVQIEQCAPHAASESAGYTAETNYQLNWQYDYISDGTTCTISRVKVGLHVNQNMPQWQPAAAAPKALATNWQRFVTNLQTHENGHVAIDKHYATQLLDDLRTMPSINCANLAASVQHLTDSDIAVLNQANDNYDTTTDHGATQGAVLPQ